MVTPQRPDYLIIGAGIVGLAIARALREKFPQASIAVLEKEDAVARHGSGRNSGVLHAGFYYTADSLKARFCRDGNRALKDYCRTHGLMLHETGKLVVATREEEIATLDELYQRGKANGVNVQLVDAHQAAEIEPNAFTLGRALYSPETATVNPTEVSRALYADLSAQGVKFFFRHAYEKRLGNNAVQAGGVPFEAGYIINAAGLYADRIARDFGFGEHYTIIPFKGIYLKYSGSMPPVRTHLYPVPNLRNPFLGVHFTRTVEGVVKIGPTAIPALWRENYKGFSKFSWREMLEIIGWEGKLFATNAFDFRRLAFEEMQKYRRSHLVGLAAQMVKTLDESGFTEWGTPGIRAQLLDTRSLKLVQDFLVEGNGKSVHVLNAVSPAFTCSFPFGEWVVESYVP